MKSKCANFACVLLDQWDNIYTVKIFQNLFVFLESRHSKNVLFWSIHDMYTKMLTFKTYASVADSGKADFLS